MKSLLKVIFLITILVGGLFIGYKLYQRSKIKYADFKPNTQMIKKVEQNFKVSVKPEFDYSYAFMESGVIQHLDRGYSYDSIPTELQGGILFQGIHKPAKGTSVTIELYQPYTIYFFFHSYVDGGYAEIFKNLEGWKKCEVAPMYDLEGGDHGKNMTMYKFKGNPGIYSIPETTADRACFNIVFQEI
ncbi:hypothetical protein [Zobellia nedashkovskayae]|uniref:hypothetical protein n=1 Tax=Zobellia nedashkovskayae TaxID=2779510 RepID=UPI00188CFF2C|nr:hypothetical protein [Zobellia nedashkovskayae]